MGELRDHTGVVPGNFFSQTVGKCPDLFEAVAGLTAGLQYGVLSSPMFSHTTASRSSLQPFMDDMGDIDRVIE